MATRPCFLVIERDYPGNISARKLVIETEKMNVISSYSAAEGVETLRRFPAVDGIVLSAEVQDMPCATAARELKRVLAAQPQADRNNVPLIVISPNGHEACDFADHRLSSHDPQELLEVLNALVKPKAA
jgi:CheY-like chemotaxis protein